MSGRKGSAIELKPATAIQGNAAAQEALQSTALADTHRLAPSFTCASTLSSLFQTLDVGSYATAINGTPVAAPDSSARRGPYPSSSGLCYPPGKAAASQTQVPEALPLSTGLVLQFPCPKGSRKFNLASEQQKAQARLSDEQPAEQQVLQEQIQDWIVRWRLSKQRRFRDDQVASPFFCVPACKGDDNTFKPDWELAGLSAFAVDTICGIGMQQEVIVCDLTPAPETDQGLIGMLRHMLATLIDVCSSQDLPVDQQCWAGAVSSLPSTQAADLSKAMDQLVHGLQCPMLILIDAGRVLGPKLDRRDKGESTILATFLRKLLFHGPADICWIVEGYSVQFFGLQPANIHAPVVIGYCGHRSEKDAKGIHFDHFVWQKVAARQTLMSQPESPDYAQQIQALLDTHARTNTMALPFSPNKAHPAIASAVHEAGLLYIPGRLRDSEHEPVRAAHEHKIIKGALLHGQPILAVCAGTWRLWEVAIELFSPPETALQPRKVLSPVKGHAYSRMMSIGSTGRVGYNIDLHLVEVKPGSLLEAATTTCDPFPVNSVHWQAPNPAHIPPLFTVSAVSRADASVTQKDRHGHVY